jgi:enamine deaminase RidA (YjgF/YER057c/UK114 family)
MLVRRCETILMIRRMNLPDLHKPQGYHHVTITDARGFVFLAGQCPLDVDGNLVGPGDLRAQTRQVAGNIAVALRAVGAAPEDVVRTVIYVASAERADLVLAWSVLCESEVAAAFGSASTLLGVAQLGYPGQLVEVDVTAAAGGQTPPATVT